MFRSLLVFMLVAICSVSTVLAHEKKMVPVLTVNSIIDGCRSLITSECAVVGDDVDIEALYLSTNGARWRDKSGWDVEVVHPSLTDFSRWHGLTISDGRLVEINVRVSNLGDQIPPELGNLASLNKLDLCLNLLSGPILPKLGQLAKLDTLNELILSRIRENPGNHFRESVGFW